MLGTEIELLISDFDGTLVDTFSANYMAYQKAFAEQGLCLSESQYRACFGFRFDEFMKEVGVVDVNISIRFRKYCFIRDCQITNLVGFPKSSGFMDNSQRGCQDICQ